MLNQNIYCLTGNDIRKADQEAQNEASREFYMKALTTMPVFDPAYAFARS